jgi:hypothetical protein
VGRTRSGSSRSHRAGGPGLQRPAYANPTADVTVQRKVAGALLLGGASGAANGSAVLNAALRPAGQPASQGDVPSRSGRECPLPSSHHEGPSTATCILPVSRLRLPAAGRVVAAVGAAAAAGKYRSERPRWPVGRALAVAGAASSLGQLRPCPASEGRSPRRLAAHRALTEPAQVGPSRILVLRACTSTPESESA